MEFVSKAGLSIFNPISALVYISALPILKPQFHLLWIKWRLNIWKPNNSSLRFFDFFNRLIYGLRCARFCESPSFFCPGCLLGQIQYYNNICSWTKLHTERRCEGMNKTELEFYRCVKIWRKNCTNKSKIKKHRK